MINGLIYKGRLYIVVDSLSCKFESKDYLSCKTSSIHSNPSISLSYFLNLSLNEYKGFNT